MTRCPACAHEAPSGSRFCPGCGGALITADVQVTKPYPNVEVGVSPSPSPPSGIGQSRFTPGQLIAERYRIVAALGKGGMGEVYRADDLKLGQSVALKFLPPELTRDPERLIRFHNEVRIARQVSHANVCRVYDLAEAGGQSFLTMEYIDGQDLAALLRQVGRLPEDKGIELARQMCLGLAAAHELGVIHRDLKPHNIMIDGRGQVRITDFGLAVRHTLAGASGFATGADVHAGTPAYMAPEQLAGKEVSLQSDLFSLGLILYEMFTGKRPFQAKTPMELRRLHEEGTPSKPSSHVSGMNPAVERVILRCLEKEPKERPRSAYEVLAGLPGGDPLAAALAAGETPSPQMVAEAGGEAGLHPMIAAACFGAILVGLVLVTLLSGQALLANRVPLPDRPEFLERRAQEVLKDLGYSDPPKDAAYGFETDQLYLKYVKDNDSSPTRWDRLAIGRPAAIYFWYRQGPRPLRPTTLVAGTGGTGIAGRVTPTDPPPLVPAMVSLQLDPQGRLLTLQIVPEATDDNPGEPRKSDWSKLFPLAGFEQSRFRETKPSRNPPIHSDLRAAWEGSWEESDEKIRLEAASYKGKVVYFQVIGPWTRPESNPFIRSEMPDFELSTLVAIAILLLISLWIAALLLAVRNLRLGRGDRPGAARLFLIVFLLSFGSYLLWAHHMAAPQELGVVMLGVAFGLLQAGLQWLYYMAVEPLVRRLWPHALITWSRLLAGRLRDPLVGRDLLIGTTVGMLLGGLGQLRFVVPAWLGLPPDEPIPPMSEALLGGRHLAGILLYSVPGSFEVGLFVALLLFLVLRIVLRKQWLAAIAYVLLYIALVALSDPSIVSGVLSALSIVILVTVLIRYGLLAVVTMIMVSAILYSTTPTPDLSAWYASSGLVGAALVVALAGCGFYTSLAGRPLFRKGWLPDEG